MRVLILSGGGSHGAFQVGVIKRLVQLGRRWDAVFGVSVGALNALHVAMHAPSEQDDGARSLEAFWLAIRGNDDVYKGWPLGMVDLVDILMVKGSIYDTSPLENFIRQRFDASKLAKSGVKLFMGAVGLGSGQIVWGTESSPDPVKWAMASSAFPTAFEPIVIDGEHYVDGGLRHTTPIAKAIAEGATELDVVIADPQTGEASPWDASQAGSAVKVGMRAAAIMANQVFVTDQDALTGYRGIAKVYSPYAPWTVDSLTFDPVEIRHQIDVGFGIP